MANQIVRVLCLGDVVGRPGRDALQRTLRMLIAEHAIDLAIVNGENASGGLGIDGATADELRSAGAMIITLGDHTWQKKEMRTGIESRKEWLIRPGNFPEGTPGLGWARWQSPSGIKVGVMNVMGRVFIQIPLECPFRTAEKILNGPLADCDIVIADVHAEATSEKGAFAHYFDGRIQFIVGTHTHVQTADERILPKGSAFISDLGMTGSLDGVIGMKKEVAIDRFLTGMPHPYELAPGSAVVQGAWCEIDIAQKRAIKIERVKVTAA